MSRLVLKFGGTSVGSAAAITQAAGVAAGLRRDGHEVVVVTSAMSGVTDLLLAGAHAAAAGQLGRFLDIAASLRAKHLEACTALFDDPAAFQAVLSPIEQRLGELSRLAEALAVLGEASPRALDAVSSLGERMSVHLLAGALRRTGVASPPVDAADVVRTDDEFQAAVPLMADTRQLAQERLLPIARQGDVPVVTGFVGATAAGVVTTLGRGGSDYSAAILGAALDADEVWIYTDVDGVLTADPRVVPEARTLDLLTYREMSELAYFGAKVLHPKTILPALERGIPLRIKNTFNPSHDGTLVVAQTEGGRGVLKGVTAIERQSLVTLEGRGMLGVPGIAGRTFAAVARTGTSVPMISQSSSEQSICFVAPQASAVRVIDELRREFEHELARQDIESIWALDDIVVVTAVGSAIRQTPGVAGRVFGAVGAADINVIAIAMGSSECSISLVVEARYARAAVRAIHRLLEA
ncbi:MAG: aspartate kinase [Acidobacteria bacterium]|nr:aspartate kinase [Acidobacteriota bacterium]